MEQLVRDVGQAIRIFDREHLPFPFPISFFLQQFCHSLVRNTFLCFSQCREEYFWDNWEVMGRSTLGKIFRVLGVFNCFHQMLVANYSLVRKNLVL